MKQILLLLSALLLLLMELWAMATERAQYILQGWRWFQLLLASLSLATTSLQLRSLSQATSCVLKVKTPLCRTTSNVRRTRVQIIRDQKIPVLVIAV